MSVFVHQYFSECKDFINRRVFNISHDVIMSKNPEEWIDELIEQYSIPFIEEMREPTHTYHTIREGIKDYGRMISLEVVYLVVEWQLKDHPKLGTTLSLMTNPHDTSLPQIEHKEGCINFKLRVGTLADVEKPFVQEKVKNELTRAIEGLRKEFKGRNEQIERGITELRSFAENIIKGRLEEIEKKNIALKLLSDKIQIPLKKKTEDIKVTLIVNKNEISKDDSTKVKLPTGRPKEYILDREHFLKFVGYIDRYMQCCERTPDTFHKLKEEEIRNLILPYLNQVFDKGASGETFSKFGKTDIYLVIDKGCILICECKWWYGPQSLIEVIDQVLKRVTWRENYGLVIIFVKDNISQVLTKAQEIIKEHESNALKNVKELDKHHFMSKNSQLDDKDKTVEIHYLFYNFPSK